MKQKKKFFLNSNSWYFGNSNSITKIRDQENSLRMFLIQSQSYTWKLSCPDAFHPLSDPTQPSAPLSLLVFRLWQEHDGWRRFRLWNKRIIRAGECCPVCLSVRSGGGWSSRRVFFTHSQSSSSPKWCRPRAKSQKHWLVNMEMFDFTEWNITLNAGLIFLPKSWLQAHSVTKPACLLLSRQSEEHRPILLYQHHILWLNIFIGRAC